MAAFINPEDYDASIHQEILDSLIRSDKQIIEICEDRAIAEMRGYLSARYDCSKVFSAQGEDRNQLVLMMAIDIAIYHIFSIHNPRNMSQIRVDRYERAIEWLKGVRKGGHLRRRVAGDRKGGGPFGRFPIPDSQQPETK